MDDSNKFDEILREIFANSSEEGQPTLEAEERYELADTEDIDIVMHRNAHFGGSFDVMLEYYERGGRGAQDEFSFSRIEYLQQVERETGQDVALDLLGDYEFEIVTRVREIYRKLREIYESTDQPDSPAKLIADLLLTEEEDAQSEVDAIVARGKIMVPYLLELLNAPEFSLSLYPGYGQAPLLAAHCLGLIKDPEAIVPLFESLNVGDFFTEATVVKALADIGAPAKAFLLREVKARPLTPDNERAARALTQFAQDPEVSHACLLQLQDPAVCKHENLAAYLVLCCEGLTQPEEQQQFLALVDRVDLANLKQDIQVIARQFAKNK